MTTNNAKKQNVIQTNKGNKKSSTQQKVAPQSVEQVFLSYDTSIVALAISSYSKTRLLGIALGVIVALLVLVALIQFSTSNYFFAVKTNGQLIELQPIDQPSEVEGAPIQYVTKALPDIMTFGYINYESHINNVGSVYFTKTGSENFKQAMVAIKLEDYMKAEYSLRLVIDFDSGGPRIVSEGKSDKGYYYVIDTNVVQYWDPAGIKQKPIANYQTIRVVIYPSNVKEKAFDIDQWAVRQR